MKNRILAALYRLVRNRASIVMIARDCCAQMPERMAFVMIIDNISKRKTNNIGRHFT